MAKPTVKLIGQDGNVFQIIGETVKAAKKAGWSMAKIEKFKRELMSGDYNNVLRVVQEYFDVI